MTPDKSTMNKTEREFEQAINSAIDGPVTSMKELRQVQAQICYQIHRKECKKYEDLLEEIDTRLSYFEDYIKGKDGVEITKLRGKINKLIYEQSNNFTSSNEGNNEKE